MVAGETRFRHVHAQSAASLKRLGLWRTNCRSPAPIHRPVRNQRRQPASRPSRHGRHALRPALRCRQPSGAPRPPHYASFTRAQAVSVPATTWPPARSPAVLAAPQVVRGRAQPVPPARFLDRQPASASRRKPMICSSVNLFFMSNLLSFGNWTLDRGATQKRGTSLSLRGQRPNPAAVFAFTSLRGTAAGVPGWTSRTRQFGR